MNKYMKNLQEKRTFQKQNNSVHKLLIQIVIPESLIIISSSHSLSSALNTGAIRKSNLLSKNVEAKLKFINENRILITHEHVRYLCKFMFCPYWKCNFPLEPSCLSVIPGTVWDCIPVLRFFKSSACRTAEWLYIYIYNIDV